MRSFLIAALLSLAVWPLRAQTAPAGAAKSPAAAADLAELRRFTNWKAEAAGVNTGRDQSCGI